MITIDGVLSRSELIELAPELANAVSADLTLPLVPTDFLDLSSPSLLYFDSDFNETLVWVVEWTNGPIMVSTNDPVFVLPYLDGAFGDGSAPFEDGSLTGDGVPSTPYLLAKVNFASDSALEAGFMFETSPLLADNDPSTDFAALIDFGATETPVDEDGNPVDDGSSSAGAVDADGNPVEEDVAVSQDAVFLDRVFTQAELFEIAPQLVNVSVVDLSRPLIPYAYFEAGLLEIQTEPLFQFAGSVSVTNVLIGTFEGETMLLVQSADNSVADFMKVNLAADGDNKAVNFDANEEFVQIVVDYSAAVQAGNEFDTTVFSDYVSYAGTSVDADGNPIDDGSSSAGAVDADGNPIDDGSSEMDYPEIVLLGLDGDSSLVSVWSTDWDVTSEPIDDVRDGVAVKKYEAIEFAGIEMPPVDASDMTFFSVQVWTEDATALEIKLVDTSDADWQNWVDGITIINETTEPALTQGQWVTIDIPLDSLNLPSLSSIGQIVISVMEEPGTTRSLEIGDMYFFQDPNYQGSGDSGSGNGTGGEYTGDNGSGYGAPFIDRVMTQAELFEIAPELSLASVVDLSKPLVPRGYQDAGLLEIQSGAIAQINTDGTIQNLFVGTYNGETMVLLQQADDPYSDYLKLNLAADSEDKAVNFDSNEDFVQLVAEYTAAIDAGNDFDSSAFLPYVDLISSGNELPVDETGAVNYYEYIRGTDEAGQRVWGYGADGSSGDDVIVFRGEVRGQEGNDILIADTDVNYGDTMSGGRGNDFIDAGTKGERVTYEGGWSEDGTNSVYFDASVDRADIRALTYSEDEDKAELDQLVIDLGLTAAADYFVDGQVYYVVADARGDKGFGTDIVSNVQRLNFSDEQISFVASINTWEEREPLQAERFYVGADSEVIATVSSFTSLWGNSQDFFDHYGTGADGYAVYAYDDGDDSTDYYVLWYPTSSTNASEGYVEAVVERVDGSYVQAGTTFTSLDANGTQAADVIDASSDEYNASKAYIRGYQGDDILIGTQGGDGLNGGAGNDFIDGKGSALATRDWETDNAQFSGKIGQYDITVYDLTNNDDIVAFSDVTDAFGNDISDRIGDTAQVIVVENAGEIDILINVDRLEFSDESLTLKAREETYAQEQELSTPWGWRLDDDAVLADSEIQSYSETWGGTSYYYGEGAGWDVYRYGDTGDQYVIWNSWDEQNPENGWVEALVTMNADGSYVRASKTIEQFSGEGTIFDDVFITEADRAYVNAGDGNDYVKFAGEGNLDGGKGDDTLIGGIGNNDFVGGIGNDILVGSLVEDGGRDNIRVSGRADFFTFEQVTFFGERIIIRNSIGDKLYKIEASEDDETIGFVTRYGSDETVSELAIGESVIVMEDLIPKKYNGLGTDLLVGIDNVDIEDPDQGYTNIQTGMNFNDDVWSTNTYAWGSVFDDFVDARFGREVDLEAIKSNGGSPSDVMVKVAIQNARFEGKAGDDIMLGGYGRDEFSSGAGSDYMDGGSEGDLIGVLTSVDAFKSAVSLVNPTTDAEKVYDIYQVWNGEYEYWAWDGNKNNPDYFRVEITGENANYNEDADPSLVSFEALDLSDNQNARWANVDRVDYSGISGRYTIEQIYLKVDENDRPVIDSSTGAYIEITEDFYNQNPGVQADYAVVYRVSDVLSDKAGGDGIDYLRNIEELNFQDGNEQLAVRTDGWLERYDRNDWNWRPEEDDVPLFNISSYEAMWDYTRTYADEDWDNNGYGWDVYLYNNDDPDNVQYILWRRYGDASDAEYGSPERIVTLNDDGNYVEYYETQARSNMYGTLFDDIIGSVDEADTKSTDEIFGYSGNDVIIAGDGRDKIKGGEGNDVIWGGDQASFGYDYAGDVAFYQGSAAQYQVIRNVLVKASEDADGNLTGSVERDAKGRVEVYSDDGNVVGKGIIRVGTASGLTEDAGYYEATIVIDSLSNDLGGEGTDILLNIEGMVFGETNDNWLQGVGRNGEVYSYDGGSSKTFIALQSSVAIDGWGDVVEMNLSGTNYDDDISAPTTGIYFTSDNNARAVDASEISRFKFNTDAGDDSYTGAADVESEVRYSESHEDYLVTQDPETGNIIVQHLVTGADSTGTDTLTDISRIIFEGGDSLQIDLEPTYDNYIGRTSDRVGGTIFGDFVDVRAGREVTYTTNANGDPVDEWGNESYFDYLVSGAIHNFSFDGGAGDDVFLAGYGRDNFRGEAGMDYFDGGSESDIVGLLEGASAFKSSVALIDPTTDTEGTFEIYRVFNDGYEYWAYNGDVNSPNYFRASIVSEDGVNYREIVDYREIVEADDVEFETLDLSDDESGAAWSNNDSVDYSGAKARYSFEQVYVELGDDGAPVFDAETGLYKEITAEAYADLGELSEALIEVLGVSQDDYALVYRVTDVLSDAAGGTGVDYLRNIEELRFSDGNEQLSISSDSWLERYDRNDWGWRPEDGQDIIDNIASYGTMWGSTNLYSDNDWDGNEYGWDVYLYSEDASDADNNQYVLWRRYGEDASEADYGSSDRIVTFNSDTGLYEEYFETENRSNMRGTLFADTIGSLDDTSTKSKDTIFAYGGDDIIIAADGWDKIKGGQGDDVIWGGGETSLGWEYAGDIAYYTNSASQYQVIRDIFVTVDTATGAVDKDADGRVQVYSEEKTIVAKGVTQETTSLSLTEDQGFYAATIVIDSLSDALGGEGVDVLIDVEGIVFGEPNTNWLEGVGRDGNVYGSDKAFMALQTSVTVEGYGDYSSMRFIGTSFDDEITAPTSGIYLTSDSNARAVDAADVDRFTFTADGGDDTYMAAATQNGEVNYAAGIDEYSITKNDAGYIVVEHLIEGADNTGTDTIGNISGFIFDNTYYNLGDSYDGNSITGSIIGSELDSSNADFAAIQGNDNYFYANGGVSYIDGGAGSDLINLGNTNLGQIDLKYSVDDGVFTITDNANGFKGAFGTITAENIEFITFYHNGEYRTISISSDFDGTGNGSVSMENGDVTVSASTVNGDGYLVLDDGELFLSASNFTDWVEADETSRLPSDNANNYSGDADFTSDGTSNFYVAQSIERFKIFIDYDDDGNEFVTMSDLLSSDLGGLGTDTATGFESIYFDDAGVSLQRDIYTNESDYAYVNGTQVGEILNAASIVDGLLTSDSENDKQINYNAGFGDIVIGSGEDTISDQLWINQDADEITVSSEDVVVSLSALVDLDGNGVIGNRDTVIAEAILDGSDTKTVLRTVVKANSVVSESDADEIILFDVDRLSLNSNEYIFAQTTYDEGNYTRVEGTALADIMIGDSRENNFQPGKGADFINGIENIALDDQYWVPRDRVEFSQVSFDRFEFSAIKVAVDDGTGKAVLDDSGRYQITGYGDSATEEAALSSSKLSILAAEADITLDAGQSFQSAYMIADVLPEADAKSYGVNILLNIDNVSFNDRWLDISVYEDIYENTNDDGEVTSKYRNLYGTIFDDVMEPDADDATGDIAINDRLEGRDGDDILMGGAGDDELNGGIGNDILHGGSGSNDRANYHGSDEVRYTITKVLVAEDAATAGGTVTVYDTSSGLILDADGNFDGYNVVQGSDAADGIDGLIGAFMVSDGLTAELGGTGNDLLIDVEQINFNDSQVDIGVRIERYDWEDNSEYDNIQITGTREADVIVDWGNGVDYNSDGSNTDDLDAYVDINTRDGNDVIFTYGGGSNITPGDGNDFVDGGANGDSNDPWRDQDEVRFDGKASRYTIDSYTKTDGKLLDIATENSISVDWDLYGDDQEFIVVSSTNANGSGTDILTNVERLGFNDSSVSVSVSVRNETDYEGNERKSIEGSVKGDFLRGGIGNDDIRGNAGDDVILGGDGGDWIDAGTGTDFIDGGDNNAPAGYDWQPTDQLRVTSDYENMEVSKAQILVDVTAGKPVVNDDGLWTIFDYSGEAALTSSRLTFAETQPTLADGQALIEVVLVSDTRLPTEAGALGVKIITGVENLSFNDEWVDIQAYSNTWEWTDWRGVTTTETHLSGTIFDDVLTGSDALDRIEGRDGDDILIGGENGDRLNGGLGDDVLDGGSNGSTGDTWRDLDVAEFYDAIEARFTIDKVYVDNASAVDGDGVIQIYDLDGNIDDASEISSTYEVLTSGADRSSLEVAFLVRDDLSSELGGFGQDLLIGVESIEFRDSQIDLGLRIEANDWDNDSNLDWVRVDGTKEDDDIRFWTEADSEQAAADSDISGRGGDDIIFGYAGGDRLSGGTGSDFIDGGADGVADEYGYVRKDEAVYSGVASGYVISKFQNGDAGLLEFAEDLGLTSLLDEYGDDQMFTVVQDTLPEKLGGTGIDIITNVEYIAFQDKYLPLSVEVNIERDSEGNEVRRYVNGTSEDDIITGGVGDDYIEGNDGDDVINAGAGADYIRPGDGDDTIDGGAGGTDEWNRDDVVSFNGNYSDYELTSSVVDGQTVVTVSDTRSDGTGTDTLVNVERIDFDDTSVIIGVSRYDDYDGNTISFSSFDGSLFGDVIVGSAGRDYIYGNDGDDELSGLDGPDTFFGGLGDDVIDGGLNGFDEFGTAGQDRVVYNQDMDAYTITYFDADGASIEASAYDGSGYIVVADNAGDAFSDGEDTLTNIEVIQFRDQEISFELSVTQIDSDNDGIADIAAISGTSGADLIEGSGIDELITGYNGDDRILGAGGDDIFIDGAGADVYVGGQGEDALRMLGSSSDYTITSGSFIATDASGNLVEDGSGNVLVGAEADFSASADIMAAISVTDNATGEVDVVATTEYIEFVDGIVGLSATVDYERSIVGDITSASITGTFADDTNLSADGLTISGISAADMVEIFAANNFISGGLGYDVIKAGAGDDVITVNTAISASGPGFDMIDGGEGSDTLYLDDLTSSWTITDAEADSGAEIKMTKSTDAGDEVVYLSGVEKVAFIDTVKTLVSSRISIDRDGDNTTDGIVFSGTDTAELVISELAVYDDIVDGAGGNDTLLGLGGADTFIDREGSSTIVGGSDQSADGEDGDDIVVYAVSAESKTVSQLGYALITSASEDGTLDYVNDVSADAVATINDAEITADLMPTIYSSVRDTYFAIVDETFDNDNDDATVDVVGVDTDYDGAIDAYFADLTQSGSPTEFEGSAAESFDEETMTLYSATFVTPLDGSEQVIYQDFTKSAVYSVSDDSDTDMLYGVEVIEFSDATMGLAFDVMEDSTFDSVNGFTSSEVVTGTAFNDEISSDTGDSFGLGAGEDIFSIVSGRETIPEIDTILDFSVAEDKISLDPWVADLGVTDFSVLRQRMVDTDGGVLISLDDYSVTLQGLEVEDFTSDNFVFVEVV